RRPFRLPGARLPNPDRVGDRVRGRQRRLARDLPRRERAGPSEAPHELAARCFRRRRIELERPRLLAPPARRTRRTTAARRSVSCVRSERRTHHSRCPPSSPRWTRRTPARRRDRLLVGRLSGLPAARWIVGTHRCVADQTPLPVQNVVNLRSLVARLHETFNDRDLEAWSDVFDDEVELVVDGTALR